MTPATFRHHVANIFVTALLLAALSASASRGGRFRSELAQSAGVPARPRSAVLV
jgi:hypothetical protein